jgi:hypothetical protein
LIYLKKTIENPIDLILKDFPSLLNILLWFSAVMIIIYWGDTVIWICHGERKECGRGPRSRKHSIVILDFSLTWRMQITYTLKRLHDQLW